MASPPAYGPSRERVAGLCDRIGDARTLRQQVLAEIHRVVGFDAHAWLLTDPETSVGVAPLADVPSALLPLLPTLIRLKYLTDVNRWTTLDGSAASLYQTTHGELSRSRLWRELLGNHGVVDLASCVFRDRFGCWGFLDLWRTGAARRFTAAEIAYLAGIVNDVTRALRRCQANTFLLRPPLEPPHPGPVVMLLSPQLRMLGQTPETDDYLRVLVPPADGRAPIPASAYNVAAQLLAVERNVDRNPPAARVHLSGGLWVSLRAARIGDAQPCGERNIAVTIEDSSPTERVSMFARACGLTARETELLGHLMTGTDTRELARRMFLSENTVQDHLKSIFTKTATRNRRSLLARALGT
ncbi:MAG TPA: helix-turn-helix transcriptional regulator [Pseudonocardiaceae bacterium]